jgi:ribonuclease P protein component
MRLPSNLRMKLARDFARVKSQGSSQAGKFLVLGVLRVEELEEFQFGLITGGKLGNAVVRNRIRRMLREVIRAHRAEIAPGWRMVVIARWRAPKATLAELEHDWLRLARRMNLLKPAPSGT